MKKIKTLEDLYRASLKRKSTICPKMPCFNRDIPAAFIISMQGRQILRLIKAGLYIYEKKIP